jgi:hypothetical protein
MPHRPLLKGGSAIDVSSGPKGILASVLHVSPGVTPNGTEVHEAGEVLSQLLRIGGSTVC